MDEVQQVLDKDEKDRQILIGLKHDLAGEMSPAEKEATEDKVQKIAKELEKDIQEENKVLEAAKEIVHDNANDDVAPKTKSPQ